MVAWAVRNGLLHAHTWIGGQFSFPTLPLHTSGIARGIVHSSRTSGNDIRGLVQNGGLGNEEWAFARTSTHTLG
eukprot:109856-Pelagomonas_calceolata.AAC.1